MINFDHITAGTAVIKEFEEKLEALCNEYQQKLDMACPGNINTYIKDMPKNNLPFLAILLYNGVNKDGKPYYTEEELIKADFSHYKTITEDDIHNRGKDITKWYKKIFDGVSVDSYVNIIENHHENQDQRL